jgi:hypothetical protein
MRHQQDPIWFQVLAAIAAGALMGLLLNLAMGGGVY